MNIDQTIEQVENLYRSVTGCDIPIKEPVALPPEREPVEYIEERLRNLSSLLRDTPIPSGRPTQTYVPLCCVWQTGAELRIDVELPGVDPDNIGLAFHDGALVVSGVRRPGWLPKDGDAQSPSEGRAPATVHTNEVELGWFRRSFPVPAGTTREQVVAELRHGVLEVRVPLTSGDRHRPLPIDIKR